MRGTCPAWTAAAGLVAAFVAAFGSVLPTATALDVSMPAIRADEVHDKGFNGFWSTVAVIDSGVGILDAGKIHPNLGTGLGSVTRHDATGGGNLNDDVNSAGGHGTHVAGIVQSNQGTYTGVAPAADLLGVRVMNAAGNMLDSVILTGAEWAINNDADVLNLSLGSTQANSNGSADKLQVYLDFVVDNPARAAAVSDSMTEFLSVAIAAGNGSQWTAPAPVEDPGSGYNGITVGGTTTPAYKQLVSWSGRRGEMSYGADAKPGKAGVDDDKDGTVDEMDEFAAPGSDDSVVDKIIYRSKPDIVAPGVDIASSNNDWAPDVDGLVCLDYPHVEGNDDGSPLTPAPGGDDDTYDFVRMDGTSMACPHVAGAAALLYDVGRTKALTEPGTPVNAELDHKVVKACLLNATDKVAKDPASPGVARDRDGSAWSHGDFQPLDDGLGAGQVDALNAYTNYLASDEKGEENPSSATRELVEMIAWDVHAVGKDGKASVFYTFESPLELNSWLTATLAWDRHVEWTDDGDGVVEYGDAFAYLPLDDLDLFLYKGKWDALGPEVARSVSGIDNVEHIHFKVSEADFYTLEVRRVSGDGEVYGLAWWTIPEPATLAVLAFGGLVLVRRRRR